MNDFTKEELFEILGLASNAYGTKARTMPIIVKLQSMIDNYCEHDFDMNDWVGDSSGCRWYGCRKCKGRYR